MPENRTYQESSLCSLGHQPQMMTEIFLEIFQNHFSDANNIEHDALRELVWQGGTTPEQTGIAITTHTSWDPTYAGKSPELIIKRNNWSPLKNFTLDPINGVDAFGNSRYLKIWQGSHSIFVITSDGASSEMLGAEVYRLLMHFSPVFRSKLKLLRFELMGLGEVTRVEEVDGRYAVPITAGYGWADQWTIIKHQPPLLDSRLQAIFDAHGDA